MRYLWTCVLVLVLLSPCALAQDEPAPDPAVSDVPRLEITLRDVFLDMDADTSLVRNITGGKLDLADEVGLDPSGTLEVRLRLRLGQHHALTASYFSVDEGGEEFFFTPIILDDKLIPAAGTLKVDLDLDYYRVGWRWEIAGRQTDKFDLETILDAAIFDTDSSYKFYALWNPFFPEEADGVDGTAGLPILGLRMQVRPHRLFAVYAELAGMTAGSYGDMIDGEIGARVFLGKHFALEGGYRILNINGEDDDDEAEIELSGAFVGGSVRF